MSSVVVDIADAVVTAIGAATLSVPVSVTRAYVRTLPRPGMTGTTATVIPALLSVAAADLRPRHALRVDIAVYVVSPGTATADADPQMGLIEELIALFATKHLGNTGSRCIGVEVRPVYDAREAETVDVITSVIFLTFQRTS